MNARAIARIAAAVALSGAAFGPALATLAAATPPAARAPVVSPAMRPAPRVFGRLRYADSLRSVNDRCVVSRDPLSPRVDPVYVNGRPVGFC